MAAGAARRGVNQGACLDIAHETRRASVAQLRGGPRTARRRTFRCGEDGPEGPGLPLRASARAVPWPQGPRPTKVMRRDRSPQSGQYRDRLLRTCAGHLSWLECHRHQEPEGE